MKRLTTWVLIITSFLFLAGCSSSVNQDNGSPGESERQLELKKEKPVMGGGILPIPVYPFTEPDKNAL